MHINGATALISGGASGLGAATARRLHGLGANVVLLDLNRELGDQTARQLGARALFIPTDVSKPDQTQAAVDAAVEQFGKIDMLVNCAGIGPIHRTVSKSGPHPLAEFKRTIAINLIGTFDMIRLAAWRMADNPPNEDGERGVIVNTASVAGYEGQVGQAAYSASKGGIIGMTITIARDLGSLGIRVCSIAPGTLDTPLLTSLGEGVGSGLATQAAFPKRTGRPEEYAMLVQQIIENPMLNGETIRLDGGIRMPAK